MTSLEVLAWKERRAMRTRYVLLGTGLALIAVYLYFTLLWRPSNPGPVQGPTQQFVYVVTQLSPLNGDQLNVWRTERIPEVSEPMGVFKFQSPEGTIVWLVPPYTIHAEVVR